MELPTSIELARMEAAVSIVLDICESRRELLTVIGTLTTICVQNFEGETKSEIKQLLIEDIERL